MAINISKHRQKQINETFQKRLITETSKQQFQDDLNNTNGYQKNYLLNPNDRYKKCVAIFSNLYNKKLPLEKYTIKTKDIQNLSMTKEIKKSSKQKQKLYIKYFKLKNEKVYTRYIKICLRKQKRNLTKTLIYPS